MIRKNNTKWKDITLMTTLLIITAIFITISNPQTNSNNTIGLATLEELGYNPTDRITTNTISTNDNETTRRNHCSD